MVLYIKIRLSLSIDFIVYNQNYFCIIYYTYMWRKRCEYVQSKRFSDVSKRN